MPFLVGFFVGLVVVLRLGFFDFEAFFPMKRNRRRFFFD